MNQSEWMACAHPGPMLYVVQGPEPQHGGFPTRKISKRKLHLWVEACRRATGRLGLANVPATPAEVERAAHAWCLDAYWGEECPLALRAALLRDLVGNPWRPVTLPYRCRECGIPCGTPASGYYCVRCGADESVCPWLTPTVLSLARAAYDERLPDGFLDPARLAVLSDALEETGYGGERCAKCCGGVVMMAVWDNPGPVRREVATDCAHCLGSGVLPHPILAHLRSPGPHAPGCHVVDLLLGLE
jgi:hypothetical protein